MGTNDANAHRDNTLLDKNKVLTEREDHDIDDWVARHGAALIRTGTGVRYKLVRDVPGDSAQPGQAAVIRFQVELLDGTVCYTSGGGTETFRIEHDDVESGLHEAIQHMSSGDSAVIVIPSHRAFGLAGDQDKIPMRSTVVYRLGLVTLRAS
ncbi:MAG TPA: FKBP-type peptidyl-prolyl cis-trans isomerase [Flavobacteriales bacterium]|nr:FKBP-type peptidyl-prolyl cis-trans isomerase [Flavobacteriales bacterium]